MQIGSDNTNMFCCAIKTVEFT